MEASSQAFGRLLDALLAFAALLLLAMTLGIGADVAFRNFGLGGIPPAVELSEDALYLVTLLSAPGLLRMGQHIRVDIILRALPYRIGWLLEWVGDVLGFLCCLIFIWYGVRVTYSSYAAGSISMKTLILPEWWLLWPMPLAFVLLAIEFIFRMHRLALAARRPRDDAVSAA